MQAPERLPRSPDLMSPGRTGLLIVDVQERLIPAIEDGARVVWNARRLLDAARILGVRVAATEQYPRGLGPTVACLAERLEGPIPEKLTFSCGGCSAPFAQFSKQGIHQILVAGIEAHVCVQQTAFDLLHAGFQVLLAGDAVGSRFAVDREAAFRRMESHGVTITTTEAAMFEWCDVAGTPEFKQISALARETLDDAQNVC